MKSRTLTHLTTKAALTLSLLSTTPAVGQTINEDIKILPSDGESGDQFGWSVAISGTTAVVGARLDDDNGTDSGSAYLFDTTTGQQITKLLPDDGAAEDNFGVSVAISGALVVVGAYGDDDNGTISGSAYLFDTTTGEQIAKLLPSDGELGDEFGWSVAICGTTAVVGARLDDDNGTDSGSAYLFDTTTGLQIAKLQSDDGFGRDHFGISVAISGTTAVVGARSDDDNGGDSGSAYIFDTTTGEQIAKLLPSDGAELDEFGYSVAINGTTAVVGAPVDNHNATESGSAYILTALLPCPADLTNDGTLDSFDLSAFLAAYNAQDPTADFNADGSYNFFDVSAFVEAFLNGCP